MSKIFKYTCLFGLIFFLGCNDNSFKKGNYSDYDPNDFYPDRGVVYRIHTYFSFRYLSKSRDIYYIYNLDKTDTLKDVLENTTLFGLHKGDVIEVLVHKDDPRINFYNGRGFRVPSSSNFKEKQEINTSEKTGEPDSSYQYSEDQKDRVVYLYDTVNFYDVIISDIKLGTHKKELLDAFGEPDSIVHRFDEFAGEDYDRYYYGRSSFIIKKDTFNGFDITNSKYVLNNIEIGQTLDEFKQIYPKSWEKRYDMGNGIERLTLLITSNPSIFEEHIKIILQDSLVHSYYTWTNN